MRFIVLILFCITLAGCKNSPQAVSYAPPDNVIYQHEEVKIKLECGDLLVGSLTYQKDKAEPAPVVILITGSSPHDRDNSKPDRPIEAYRPFRQISDLLSSNGIAVLRMDDRGIGQSKGGNISNLMTPERAGDIEECLNYIKNRPKFDSSRICLMGLSEGASIAHMIAAKDQSIKGIALLSGIGSKGKNIIEFQIENGVMDGTDLSKQLRKSKNLNYLYHYDPLETIRLIHQPVLIISGKLDRYVPYTDAYNLSDELRNNGNEQVTVEVFQEVNHILLKEEPADNQSDYGKITSIKIPDEILSLILNWVQSEI